MRGQCCLGLFLIFVATSAHSKESFPYKIAIKSQDVSVRSGPGDDYYQTNRVTVGDEVEVYKRAAGGWLAIRPLADSFNWVDASKLRMTNDPDVAKVVGSNAVAWIGSPIGSLTDHKWQVKLEPGEPVQLKARKSLSIFQGDETRDFYQIMPPAGDFRWVQEKDVLPLIAKSPEVDSTSQVKLTAFQIVAEEEPIEAEPVDGFVPVAASSSSTSTTTSSEPAARVASLAPRTGFQPGDVGRADFDKLATSLEVDLSETVAKSPSQWRLASLRQDAESLLEQSDTTLHRGKARLLLEKIKEFEKLQIGYAGIEGGEPLATIAPKVADMDGLQIGTTDASPTLNGFDPRFDGRGWLLPVHSSKQASPPYALLDQDGQILVFVSPAPGLNLHRYLRKEVGIFGQRSRAEFLKKPHLTADRIVDLDRHRR